MKYFLLCIVCIIMAACQQAGIQPATSITIRNIHKFGNYQFYNNVAPKQALASNQQIPVLDSLPLQLYAVDTQNNMSTDTVTIYNKQLIQELYIHNIQNHILFIKCKLVNDKIVATQKLTEVAQEIAITQKLQQKSNTMLYTSIGIIIVLAILFLIQNAYHKKQVHIPMKNVDGDIYLN
jgi:hypothetical protein